MDSLRLFLLVALGRVQNSDCFCTGLVVFIICIQCFTMCVSAAHFRLTRRSRIAPVKTKQRVNPCLISCFYLAPTRPQVEVIGNTTGEYETKTDKRKTP